MDRTGERTELNNIIYRPPRGKFDALNFGLRFFPKSARIVILNDVDTRIVNLERGLRHFTDPKVGLVYGRIEVPRGAYRTLSRLMDAFNRRFPIAAWGQLMFFRRELLEKITPMEPCKAEDNLLLFKTLKLGHKVVFDPECHVLTFQTSSHSPKNEELFKRKSVCGIYRALYLSHAPFSRKLFYAVLPFASPLLLVAGRKGWYWMGDSVRPGRLSQG